jgi:hypothetical protein
MRTSTRTLTALTAGALLLAGCSAGDPDRAATSTAPAPAPSDPLTEPAPTPSATGAGGGVPVEAVLPDTAWDLPAGQRQDSAGVVDWQFPGSCGVGAPETATAMRTITQGDGEAEAQVGLQQVALFADADAAVAEADRVVAALTACAAAPGAGGTTYVVEPVEVGAQGTGLATDYYGASAGGSLDDAMGSYLALTRRGSAITLVGVEGGESTVGAARGTATAQTQSAWALLCGYDSTGC